MGNGDTPYYPHIKCEKCGTVTVRWGRGGRLFLFALVALMGASGTITYRVQAGESDVQTVKDNIAIIGRNQGKMDERQRIAEANDALVAAQMRAMLQKLEVTERIEAPRVEPSDLEDLVTE